MKQSFKKMISLSAIAGALGAQVLAPVTALAEEDNGILTFDSYVENEGEHIEGGTLRIALVSDTPFAGVLSPVYYSGVPDSTVINYFGGSLYGYDKNFRIDNSGLADIEFDAENKQVTISIPEGVNWHDGEPLTIDDVIYPYYLIGHPDYTGIRYGVDYSNVVGMEEYHNGEAEEIEGIERLDDYSVRITYNEFSNSMLQAGGGISGFVVPEHIYSQVDIADHEDADFVRTNPVGFGPFKVESITPGEAVTYVRNDDYYRGAPNIEKVVLEVVDPTTVVTEMKAGNYDVAELPADQYDTFKDATNFSVLGIVENAFTYIGFKQGVWDEEAGEVAYDPDRITSNKALRQAMAWAIDNDAIGREFYSGLRMAANSPIVSFFEAYNNPDLNVYSYDPDKAREVLAEAGFEDLDGDGFVEDPNGESFSLGFASMSGSEIAEALSMQYIQWWEDVGIKVELVDGQLMEFNSFYERLQADDEAIDIYQGAFGTGGNPNPSGFFGRNAPFNYMRWADEKNDELLANLGSDAAFEQDYLVNTFYEWQDYIMEEIPMIPTLFRQSLTAVNKRVSNWNVETGNDLEWSEIYLNSEEPVRE